MTPAELIAAYLKLDAWVDSERERFETHMKPLQEQLEAIKTQLQAFMLEEKTNSIKTDDGTAYLSTIVSPTIEGDKLDFVEWAFEHHQEAMVQIGAPQKAALQDYLDANGGVLPPMVRTSSITRVNIRRS
jgi:hypothetical protein